VPQATGGVSPGGAATCLVVVLKSSSTKSPGTQHFLEFFRRWFGPTISAFEQVGPEGEEALAADLKAVAARYNRAGEQAAAIAAEYVQVTAVRA
jgi:hypothetical protein